MQLQLSTTSLRMSSSCHVTFTLSRDSSGICCVSRMYILRSNFAEKTVCVAGHRCLQGTEKVFTVSGYTWQNTTRPVWYTVYFTMIVSLKHALFWLFTGSSSPYDCSHNLNPQNAFSVLSFGWQWTMYRPCFLSFFFISVMSWQPLHL